MDCKIKNILKNEIFDRKLLSIEEIKQHPLISEKLAEIEAQKERERILFEKRHEEYIVKVSDGEIESEKRSWRPIEEIAEDYCKSNYFDKWEYEDGLIKFHRYNNKNHNTKNTYLTEDRLRQWAFIPKSDLKLIKIK